MQYCHWYVQVKIAMNGTVCQYVDCFKGPQLCVSLEQTIRLISMCVLSVYTVPARSDNTQRTGCFCPCGYSIISWLHVKWCVARSLTCVYVLRCGFFPSFLPLPQSLSLSVSTSLPNPSHQSSCTLSLSPLQEESITRNFNGRYFSKH